MAFCYITNPLRPLNAGQFAQITVRIPKTAKAGDLFRLQICEEDEDGNPYSWKDGVTGETGRVYGSSGTIYIISQIYGDLEYSVTNDNEINIIGCNENATSVEIPEEIDGKRVTSIGYSAFSGCTNLTEITIPNSITSIEESAFSGCASLKNVYISDLESWCKIDFSNHASNPLCNGANLYINGELVTKLTIPDDVTEIGTYAFSGCTSLREITIPNASYSHVISELSSSKNLKVITYDDVDLKRDYYHEEHKNCSVLVATNVTSLEVKSKEGKIPAAAYQSCRHLKEATLEEGITLIEDDAFANCDNLEKIVIPRSVTGIRYTAFTYDTKLTMYGYKDTYAEKYAEIFGFPFVALDDSDTPPVTTTTTTETTTTTTTTTTTAAIEITPPDTEPPATETTASTTQTLPAESTTTTTTATTETVPPPYTMLPGTELPATETTASTSQTLPAESTTTTTNTTAATETTTVTTAATTTTKPTPTLAKGDLDGSDNIDSTDIYYALYYVANIAVGNSGGLTREQIAAADVDGSGFVDSTDIYYMLYYVALHGAGIHQTWAEILAK
ncbi:leucine-rich repeat protein [Ruminococcus sp.]